MPSPPSKTPATPPSWPQDQRLPISAGLGLLWLLTACALLATLGIGGYNLLLGRRPPGATPPLALVESPLPSETVQPAATPTIESTATLPVAAEPDGTLQAGCEESWLFVHERVLRIEPLALNADGSVTVPADRPGVAFWLEGPPGQHAFGLSRTPENAGFLDELQAGEPVTLLWRGCILEESTLLAVESHVPGEMVSFDQDAPGVSLFVQEEGTLVAGEPDQPTAAPGQATLTSTPASQATQVTPAVSPAVPSPPTNTPIPPPSTTEIEAEIGFLGKRIAASTITLDISVYNYGVMPFSITMADVRLLPPNQSPVYPSSANPSLPYLMNSTVTQNFTFTFPNPAGSGIVFQLFNVEFNLDDF